MGTEGETEVDDDGRGLDEGGDKQDRCRLVGGICSGEEVEDESVECITYFNSITRGMQYFYSNRTRWAHSACPIIHEVQNIHIGSPFCMVKTAYFGTFACRLHTVFKCH